MSHTLLVLVYVRVQVVIHVANDVPYASVKSRVSRQQLVPELLESHAVADHGEVPVLPVLLNVLLDGRLSDNSRQHLELGGERKDSMLLKTKWISVYKERPLAHTGKGRDKDGAAARDDTSTKHTRAKHRKFVLCTYCTTLTSKYALTSHSHEPISPTSQTPSQFHSP